MPKTLFRFMGGKARQAGWIAGHVDKTPHRGYVEACCGAASVLWAKKRSKVEIINDKDDLLTAIFLALRDNPDEAKDFCRYIEYSYRSFRESIEIVKEPPPDMPRWKLGCWVLYRFHASFGGGICGNKGGGHAAIGISYATSEAARWAGKVNGDSDWGSPGHAVGYGDRDLAGDWAKKVNGEMGDYGSPGHALCYGAAQSMAGSWDKRITGLDWFIDRLQGVAIICKDVLQVVRQADRDQVLIYVDPPYFGGEHYYRPSKQGFAHAELRDTLHNLKHAKVILSHYNISPYKEWYADWRQESRPSTKSSQGNTEHNTGQTYEKCMETLYFNYP